MVDKIENLKKTYDFWTEKTINQLSFFNNLLLTISIGFISLSFKDMGINNIQVSFCDINISLTCLVLSLLTFVFSILIGLIVALSRLFDFRHTRNICLNKYEFYKRTNTELHSNKNRKKYLFIKRIFLIFALMFKDKKIKEEVFNQFITKNQIDGFEEFDHLREIVYNLGIATWENLSLQIITFFLGLVGFVIGFLLK